VPGESEAGLARAAAEKLLHLLAGYRFRPAGELELQDALARVFAAGGVEARREHRLSPGDVVDFLLLEGVAVEVKVAGSAVEVARQLQRYAGHSEVLALVLVTTRERLVRALPAELGGKRLFKVALGGGF
jgi:hypothetical protein